MKILDIETKIHWSWWIFASLIVAPTFTLGIGRVLLSVWAVFILMILVITHEFAHALAARHFGFETRSITLFLLGGIAIIELKKGFKPREEFFISLAGPLFNIVVALPFAALAFFVYPNIEDGLWLHCIWALNMMMGIGNLIPAYPMDGGRILRAGITALGSGREAHLRATKIANVVSGVLIFLSIASGIYLQNVFLILFGAIIWFVAYKERKYIG